MIDLVKNYSINARRIKKSVIRELLKLTDRPEIISFAGGLPSPATFPVKEIDDIVSVLLKKDGKRMLQYSATEGYPELKEQLAKWMTRDGINVGPNNIAITVASQQGLDLVGKIFIDPSDPIILEVPSYLGGISAFRSYGANLIGIPLENDGMNIDLLEAKLKQLQVEGEHYKAIYIVPDFQNPGGITMSLEKRKRVVELSRKFDVLLFEDSPYRELRFEGETPPSIFALDDENNVISLRTFSKIFAPGFRLGWVVAHEKVIDKIITAMQATNLCTSAFVQAIVAEFMKRGLLENNIERAKTLYFKKKKIMIGALEKYMPQREDLTWTNPEGGLFLWVSLPEKIDTEEMFEQAIKKNVAYIIGTAFDVNGESRNCMRLNFSYPTEDQIEEGVKRLAETVKSRL